MTVPAVPSSTEALTPAATAALDHQLAAEHTMVRFIIRGIILTLPGAIALLIGMMALALADTQPWYVWVGLGTGLGIYAAGFFGAVGGVMLSAHQLDQTDADAGHAPA